MNLTHGQAYSADISLGMIESLASNEDIEERLTSVGFVQVFVTGSGRHRTVKGRWNGPTGEYDVPSKLENVCVIA